MQITAIAYDTYPNCIYKLHHHHYHQHHPLLHHHVSLWMIIIGYREAELQI